MAGTVPFLRLFAGAFFFLCLSRTGLAIFYGGNYAGGCSLLDQTIFCHGGYTDIKVTTARNDLFGLNISQPITVAEAEKSWVNLTAPSNNIVIEGKYSFAMESVPQRGYLVVDGGAGSNSTELNNLTTIYFPNNNTWVNMAGSRKDSDQVISKTMTADAQGNNLFLWGGQTAFVNTSGYYNYTREMRRINLDTGEWGRLSSPPDNILSRLLHTAVLAKDDRTIYFFGGMEIFLVTNDTDDTKYYTFPMASMSEIVSYDTVNDSWNVTTTTGNVVPPGRYMHTTTLIGSGEIVLYGGTYLDGLSGSNITIFDGTEHIHILNPDSMSWRNQTLSGGNEISPGGIFGHSAVYAGNDSLFFLFGMSQSGINSRFSILNTKQWAWTTTFGGIHPTPVTNATESIVSAVDSNGGGGGLSSGGIAGVVVGVIVGLGIIAAAGFFLYRARKKSAANPNEPTTPTSDPKISEDFNSSTLSSTSPQNAQEQTYFTLKVQPTYAAGKPDLHHSNAYAAGKPDVYHYNVINEGESYVPQLRMDAVKPEGE